MHKFPRPQNTPARSLYHIKKKKKGERNKLILKKAISEIIFKPIARQKVMKMGKETEMRTREY